MKNSRIILILAISMLINFSISTVSTMKLKRFENVSNMSSLPVSLSKTKMLVRQEKDSLVDRLPIIQKRTGLSEKVYQIFSKINRLSGMRRYGGFREKLRKTKR